MLTFDLESGTLLDPGLGLIFADQPYRYALTGSRQGGPKIHDEVLNFISTRAEAERTVVTGEFKELRIELAHHLGFIDGAVEETLVVRNTGDLPVSIENISAGFCADLALRPNWRLIAVPFRVQLDGSLHDYPTQALVAGQFKNAVFTDETQRYWPALTEGGILRSEAWAWGTGEQGCVVIKYNNLDIELSVARPFIHENAHLLQFGGAGFCLFAEPSRARWLEPGAEFSFGTTTYIPYQGGLNRAYEIYRAFLDDRGHTFPSDYNPPVNWNELYDVGWHHSRPQDLKQYYTREALLGEAAKAKDIGCELLYLDPGWEVCEGTSLWDQARLGDVDSLVTTLKDEYGLDLGFRTILRTYQDLWPAEYRVKHNQEPYEPAVLGDQYFWEMCACNPAFWEEKLKRLLRISSKGIRFMMVDEFDWRGPCYDEQHSHPVPTTPLDHVKAVYALCREIRRACPGLTIEAHDPIWPWSTSIYVPTYFQQGFGPKGSYDENWGFEYMWDCLNDLKSGRALALYYYNLGCSIPLYLHITMAADNDHCVFFWWVASTVRHVGIGGKVSHQTIEPPVGLPARDPEKRYVAYRAQMQTYRELKPYFVRGTFHGIAENAHLHTLAGKKGGVLNLFNLTDEEQNLDVFLPAKQLGSETELPVVGAEAEWTGGGVRIRIRMKAMSPAVVCIGEAIDAALKQ